MTRRSGGPSCVSDQSVDEMRYTSPNFTTE